MGYDHINQSRNLFHNRTFHVIHAFLNLLPLHASLLVDSGCAHAIFLFLVNERIGKGVFFIEEALVVVPPYVNLLVR